MCDGSHRMYRHMEMHCCRHFPTREEKIQHLEEYKKWLEQEAKGVSEAIQELKKAS